MLPIYHITYKHKHIHIWYLVLTYLFYVNIMWTFQKVKTHQKSKFSIIQFRNHDFFHISEIVVLWRWPTENKILTIIQNKEELLSDSFVQLERIVQYLMNINSRKFFRFSLFERISLWFPLVFWNFLLLFLKYFIRERFRKLYA